MKKRIFIVGIARSGTTLLQSFIGNHPSIYTFPETHFFSATIPKQKWLRPFHKITSMHKKLVEDYFLALDKQTHFKPYLGSSRNMNDWTQYLIHLLDGLALSEKYDIWLEKTPMHLHFIDLISKNTDHCYFIHTIREPKANIAALYDVSKNHPQSFQQNSLKKAVDRYVSEIYISEKFIQQNNHFHVYYEDLVTQPEMVIKGVLNFLELPFDKNIMNFQGTVEKITTHEESWKSNNSKELLLKDKIQDRLTTAEIKFITEQISSCKPSLLSKYEAH